MKRFLASRLRRALRRLGLDMVPFNAQHADFVLDREMKRHGVTTTLDVGANRGQFASRLRRYGFSGTIHSFEPVPDALKDLRRLAARDGRWHVHPYALGDAEKEAVLHVGSNDQTSSLLSPNQRNLDATDMARTVREIRVPVRRLADIAGELGLDPRDCFLKLDVQGAEAAVLDGADGFLDDVPLVQLETSFDPLYRGETAFWPLTERLRKAGYAIVSLVPGFADPSTGALLQVDVILSRLSARSRTA